ncbi:hypothetical protein Salat_1423400 [Sesamum alatum]|uniref:HTH myb-type domain-containing protein n=1 Tax=Sesamum alatum TaxID=300844 RepID=A0AAE1YAD7_9LAMI|nr:hypothetical protein Salat_1423400 [Sesamum alatum]
MIAGRLPGRTTNDVKNLWNNHIEKIGRAKVEKTITSSNIVRPQPRIPSNLKVGWPRETRETVPRSNLDPVTNEEKQTGETSAALHDLDNDILESDGDEFGDLNIDVDFGELMRFGDTW